MILYHGSNADFDAFSDDFLVREDSGPNSALGIWLGEKWVANGFGRYTYKVDAVFEKPCYMDLDCMVRHHKGSEGDPVYFSIMRADHRKRGHDAIFVREADGLCPTVVALDITKLRILEKEIAKKFGG